jgi:hypothetical protein
MHQMDQKTKRERGQAAEQVKQHAEEMRRESRLEGAWTHALRNVWLKGKQRLVDADSNRAVMESLLQPHEEPSAALYSTIALTYPTKFAWETPQRRRTDADRLVEFARACRENDLSECAANQQLHKEGVGINAWAGASGLERAAFQAEAQATRQKFLINSASPSELKAEAVYQSQTERAVAVKAEADRQHQYVSQQQQGLYPILPTHSETGEALDARYFHRLSTLNFKLFKKLVKRYGTAQITEVLRTPTV